MSDMQQSSSMARRFGRAGHLLHRVARRQFKPVQA